MSGISHRAAVLGSPIEHSRSPLLHNAGYRELGLDDWEYGRFECTAEQLPERVSGLGDSYVGFSVTMPAKFAALEFADEVSDRAHQIGSANTLVRTSSGWRADNTDCDGIAGALRELLAAKSPAGMHALVLGGGGTARPALWTLANEGVAKLTVLNRSDKRAELAPLATAHGAEFEMGDFSGDLEKIALSADLIVSTLPAGVLAGMERQLAHAPVFDVLYEPWPTPLTVQAAANGHRSVGGHVMLAHQAYGQFEQFTGIAAPREAMWQALEKSLS
ncbi:Shikimate dehydrogenase [Corynebacterium occultum]|uniref:Shikimate dehydrogenase n=1 Tax=Corynebacterium occultum TaxID=2675219 RepID=A0A6B8VPL4_9CORY|nr:shikimate dehydrogenase [Corynebacterium occultum]QGU07522.1 Shikimate dehydrogenase [Corynebacterium occultum]